MTEITTEEEEIKRSADLYRKGAFALSTEETAGGNERLEGTGDKLGRNRQ